jgi:hypothetical protein
MNHSKQGNHEMTTTSEVEVGARSEKMATENAEADRPSSYGSKPNAVQEPSEKNVDELEVRKCLHCLVKLELIHIIAIHQLSLHLQLRTYPPIIMGGNCYWPSVFNAEWWTGFVIVWDNIRWPGIYCDCSVIG